MKILLVDDHVVMRTALRLLLEQEQYEIIGEAGSMQESIEQARKLVPDLILMDITLPDGSGVEATRRICEENPSCKVIALTMHMEKEYLVKFLEAGGVGYVHKSAADQELIRAIETVKNGNIYMGEAGIQVIAKQHLSKCKNQDPDPSILSEREMTVAKYVARGKTSAEIGKILYLSPRTIDTYRERVMKKLRVSNRSELVDYVIRHQMFD